MSLRSPSPSSTLPSAPGRSYGTPADTDHTHPGSEGGINENSSYYVLTQCEDGTLEAVPVSNWYSFTADITYQTLTSKQAEEEYKRRERRVNYFSLMVKKRLADSKGDMEEGEHCEMNKSSKTASRTANLVREMT